MTAENNIAILSRQGTHLIPARVGGFSCAPNGDGAMEIIMDGWLGGGTDVAYLAWTHWTTPEMARWFLACEARVV